MSKIKPKMVDGEAVCGGGQCHGFYQFDRTDYACSEVNPTTDPCIVTDGESMCAPYYRARVAELEAEVAEAIKEIGVWSRKAGLAEAARDTLQQQLEDRDRVIEVVRGLAEECIDSPNGHCACCWELSDFDKFPPPDSALLPTPPKGGSK